MKMLRYGLWLLVWPLSVMAAPAAMTLEDAMRLALENQPHLQVAEDTMRAQTEMRYISSDDPELAEFKFAIDLFRRKQEQLVEDISSLALGFVTVEKRKQLRAQRQRQISHTAAELNYLRSQITSNAGIAWANLYYAQQALPLLRDLQREYQDQIESANISYRAGKGSQQDIWKAQDQLNAAREREIDLKTVAARAQAELLRWTGAADVQPNGSKMTLPAPESLAELRTRLMRHPAQLPYTFSEALAESELRISKAAYKPDPKTEYHPQDVILSTMQVLLEKIQHESADNLRMLDVELVGAYSEWQAFGERAALYEKSTVPNARRRLDATLIAYRGGKADLGAVLEARRTEIETRLQLLELTTSAIRARLKLNVYEQPY